MLPLPTTVLLSHLVLYTSGLSPWSPKSDRCSILTDQCVPINSSLNRTCLGIQLPYEFTAPDQIVEDVGRYRLELWTALRAIPSCWDKLEFFLCSVYFPECVERETPAVRPLDNRFGPAVPVGPNNTLVEAHQTGPSYHVILPEAEMCEAVHRACPLLVGGPSKGMDNLESAGRVLLHPLPRFLDCSLYTRGCRQNSLTARLFQSTGGGCSSPLVTTTIKQNWLPGIDRCSFPCRRPHFDAEDYRIARLMTGISAGVLAVVNVIVLITLYLQHSERRAFLRWMSSTSPERTAHPRYSIGGDLTSAPHVLQSWCLFQSPLFYMHLFFLLSCLGWLMPSIPGLGDSVACRADNTLRTGEPQISQGKAFLCVVNFMIVYVCLVTAAVWSLVLDHFLLSRGQFVAQLLNVDSAWPVENHRKKFSTTDQCTADHALVDLESSRSIAREPAEALYTGDPQRRPLLRPSEQVEQRSKPVVLSGTQTTNHRDGTPTGSPERPHKPARPLLFELFETGLKFQVRMDPSSSRHKSKHPSHKAVSDWDGPILCSPHHSSIQSSSSQSACLHVLTLAPSFTLALISLTASEIDGDSLTGLCTIGRINVWARCFLVLAPFTLFVCLKVIFTGRLAWVFHRLQHPFSKSAFLVDQDYAQRIRRSLYSHVGILLTLITLWVLSIAVEFYVFVREPGWLESQRSLFLCQLSYRLLGLNSQSAQSACLNTPFITAAEPYNRQRVRRQLANMTTTTPESAVARGEPQLWTSIWLTTPVTGPIMLQLMVCFILNAVTASACLFDRSVRQCWRAIWSKLPCHHQTCSDTKFIHPTEDLLQAHFLTFFSGFSWWDPGLFAPPPLCVLVPQHSHSSYNPTMPVEKACQPDPPICDGMVELETTNEDIVAQLDRLITLYRATDPPNPALPLFLHMRQQLVSGGGGQPRHDVSAQVHDSLDQLTAHAAVHNTDPDGQLFASVAALCDQLGRQLTVSGTNTGGRRSRHHRLLSNKALGRRRVHTRSLSINELFSGTSSRMSQSVSGPNLIVPRRGSEAQRSSALSLLRAAASMISGASATNSLNATTQRNASAHALNTTGGCDSVCGASQVSSSSVHSAMTRIASSALPKDPLSFSYAPKTCASSSISGRPSLPRDATSLGSRMSLRSVSATSSSGAESYNSYRLLVNQAGAGWRELWRTRMLLMDVLRWAEAVAPTTSVPANTTTIEPAVLSTDWGKRFLDMVGTLIAQQQQIPNTADQTSSTDQSVPSPSCSNALDPMMAAALAAATAAATVAMQQQQQQQQKQREFTPNPLVSQNQTPSTHISVCSYTQPFTQTPDHPVGYVHPQWGQMKYPVQHSAPTHLNQTACYTTWRAPSSSSGFPGQPDLLMDHARFHPLSTHLSPSCSPPFVVHRLSHMPGYRGPVEHRAAMFARSPGTVVHLSPPTLHPPVGGPLCADPMSYSLPVEPIVPSYPLMEPSAYPPLQVSGHHHHHQHHSDDSDAFDSEDDVMSDGDDEERHVHALDGIPTYGDGGEATTSATTASSVAEDCDVSSVSQSASQVAPRASSSSDDDDNENMGTTQSEKRQTSVTPAGVIP